MNPEATLRRRLLVYGPLILLLGLVQLQLSLWPASFGPDFLLLLPLLAGLWTPGYDSFILGLLAGFLKDYAAGRGYGAGMLLTMALGLMASYLGREGWRAYLLRAGALVLGASFIQEEVLSFLAWLVPLTDRHESLGRSLLLSLGRLPSIFLANLLGTLFMTLLLALLFSPWKKTRGGEETAFSQEVHHA